MFGFLKKIFSRKKSLQEEQVVNAPVQLSAEKENEYKAIIQEAYINEEYDAVYSIASEIALVPKYKYFSDDLKDILLSKGKKEFKKEDLTDFLINAENVMNTECDLLATKKKLVDELRSSVSAIEDIFRIENLIKDASTKTLKLNNALSNILEKIDPDVDTDDILLVSEEFNETYIYVKDISYALGFLKERVDLLINRDTEIQSIVFYADRYKEYDSTFSNIAAKMNALQKNSDELEEKLEMYKKRAVALKGKGLINLDWDGSKFRQLEQIRKGLTEGYEKLENGCWLVKKNALTIIENLTNSDSELYDYVVTLIPKLTDNVERLKPKYQELTDKYKNIGEETESLSVQIKRAIEILNTLY